MAFAFTFGTSFVFVVCIRSAGVGQAERRAQGGEP